MIVRIAEEGQYRLSDEAQVRINELDNALEESLSGGGFSAALAALLQEVRTIGEPVGDAELLPSDVVLPPADATADEVRAMLGEEGLIPG
jgi:hypothetical protein